MAVDVQPGRDAGTAGNHFSCSMTAVLLLGPETEAADLDGFGECLNAAFAAPFQICGHHLNVRASIGHARFPADADSASRLLRAADTFMFANKRLATANRAR